MMINIYEAKNKFSKLIDQAESGEEVVISRAGKPVAKIIPYNFKNEPRVPGDWKGKVKIHEDFDELPQNLIDAFSGRSE